MKRFLVGAVVCVGCYKAAPAPPPTAAQPPSAPLSARPAHDYRAALGDPLGFLPIDSELVVAIDGDQVRKSPLWAMAEQRIRGAAGAKLATFSTMCGVDPIAKVRSPSGWVMPTEMVVFSGCIRQHLDCSPNSSASHAPKRSLPMLAAKANGTPSAFSVSAELPAQPPTRNSS